MFSNDKLLFLSPLELYIIYDLELPCIIDNSKNNINNLNIKKIYTFQKSRAPVDKKKLSYYLNHLKKVKLKKNSKA